MAIAIAMAMAATYSDGLAAEDEEALGAHGKEPHELLAQDLLNVVAL